MSSKPDERGPFSNAHFRVDIDGLQPGAALEVVLPDARIVSSGESTTTHYGALILRRGLTTSSTWYQWWDGARASSGAHRRTVVVILLEPSGAEVHRWTFHDALPTAYGVSPLSALGDAILIETLELSVGGLDLTFGSAPAP